MSNCRTQGRRLPRQVWLVLGAEVVSSIGGGMTYPFLLMYLHDGLGMSLPAAGVVLTTAGVGGLVGSPASGWLSDQLGAKASLVVTLVLAATGVAGIAIATQPAHVFVAIALSGMAVPGVYTCQDTLLAKVTSKDQRSTVFGLRHAALNAGLGIGALVATQLAGTGGPAGLAVLFWIDAATFVVAASLVSVLSLGTSRGHRDGVDTESGGAERAHSRGYRDVARDGPIIRLWVLTVLLFTVGFSQLQITVPIYGSAHGGIAPAAIGVFFAANSIAVVLCQLGAIRVLRGVRRTRALYVMVTVWAMSWMLIVLAAATGSVVVLAAAGVVFAAGEAMFAPTVPAIANDIAPDRLRGRYNGSLNFAQTAGFALGPALAGLGLEWAGTGWVISLAVVCCACVMMVVSLERVLPISANVIDRNGAEVG